jgi:hypothetical protein
MPLSVREIRSGLVYERACDVKPDIPRRRRHRAPRRVHLRLCPQPPRRCFRMCAASGALLAVRRTAAQRVRLAALWP